MYMKIFFGQNNFNKEDVGISGNDHWFDCNFKLK